MKPSYTKITIETYYALQDDYRKNVVFVKKWDCSLYDVLDLMEDLLHGAGFKIDGSIEVVEDD